MGKEKRTEEGKRRHDLGKKIWYAEKKAETVRQEVQNGIELGYPGVRISNYWREKIERGETQILDTGDGKFISFKKAPNGYWRNHSTGKVLYLHREKMRLYLGMTQEQMKDYDVHHIDENKDNNDILNLKLLTRKEHNRIHSRRNEDSKRHVCKRCGRTYYANASKSMFYCNRCGGNS